MGTDQPTDRPTNRPTDGRTKRGVVSRSTRLKTDIRVNSLLLLLSCCPPSLSPSISTHMLLQGQQCIGASNLVSLNNALSTFKNNQINQYFLELTFLECVLINHVCLSRFSAPAHLSTTEKECNKAGYTATPVACGWAGAIIEVTPSFGQEQ